MKSSNAAVVQFINGLFDAEHPLDSVVEYPNTENVSQKLRRLLSDMVVIINGICVYHLEAEIGQDENIVIRVFEYGFVEGLRTKKVSGNGQKISIAFPNARIIYWETTKSTPDDVTLSLEFPEGGHYDYVVKTFKFLDYGIKELEEKKLAILLPFYVLKLRKRVVSAKSSKRRSELSAEMKTIVEDIVAAVERAAEVGLLGEADARVVLEYTEKLYQELYQGYDEFKEADVMLQETILTYSEEAELRGIEKGIVKGRFKVAEKMLARGMALPEVAELVDLSVDKLKSLSLRSQTPNF